MPDIFISKEKKPQISNKNPLPGIDGVTKSTGPLSSFWYMPKNIDFETKDQREEVVLLLRRHPITNIGWIIIFVLMLFAPAVLGSFPILGFMPDRFQFMAVVAWYLITTAYFLENFLDWFFNVNIITDERVMDFDFSNLIYKQVSDAKLDKIQDISYKMGGAVRTIFNYGDVVIQTASEIPNFEFEAVPRPDKVVEIMQYLISKEENENLKREPE
jgi:uncharacterized membrane protein YdbT with pleckstrin-like domain